MEMASLLVVRVLHFNTQQDFKLIFSPMFVASLILHDQASKNYIFWSLYMYHLFVSNFFLQGMRGDPGSPGSQGPKGDKGANGTQGLIGERGEKVPMHLIF